MKLQRKRWTNQTKSKLNFFSPKKFFSVLPNNKFKESKFLSRIQPAQNRKFSNSFLVNFFAFDFD